MYDSFIFNEKAVSYKLHQIKDKNRLYIVNNKVIVLYCLWVLKVRLYLE